MCRQTDRQAIDYCNPSPTLGLIIIIIFNHLCFDHYVDSRNTCIIIPRPGIAFVRDTVVVVLIR